MDQLQIKDLEIFAYHGLFPSEKELGQKFVISAILSYDMTKAATDLTLLDMDEHGIDSWELQENNFSSCVGWGYL